MGPLVRRCKMAGFYRRIKPARFQGLLGAWEVSKLAIEQLYLNNPSMEREWNSVKRKTRDANGTLVILKPFFTVHLL